MQITSYISSSKNPLQAFVFNSTHFCSLSTVTKLQFTMRTWHAPRTLFSKFPTHCTRKKMINTQEIDPLLLPTAKSFVSLEPKHYGLFQHKVTLSSPFSAPGAYLCRLLGSFTMQQQTPDLIKLEQERGYFGLGLRGWSHGWEAIPSGPVAKQLILVGAHGRGSQKEGEKETWPCDPTQGPKSSHQVLPIVPPLHRPL